MLTNGDFHSKKYSDGRGVEFQIKEFILSNFLFQAKDIDGDQSLIDAGIIDSTGVVELVAYLEDRFGIRVGDDELVPENLDSISRIAAFVSAKKGV